MTNQPKSKLKLSEGKLGQLLSAASNQHRATHDIPGREDRIRIDKMSAPDSPHILNERSVREGARPVVVSIPDAHSASDWQINLERDGDIIRVIHIACCCGKQLSIQCDYSSTKK